MIQHNCTLDMFKQSAPRWKFSFSHEAEHFCTHREAQITKGNPTDQVDVVGLADANAGITSNLLIARDIIIMRWEGYRVDYWKNDKFTHEEKWRVEEKLSDEIKKEMKLKIGWEQCVWKRCHNRLRDNKKKLLHSISLVKDSSLHGKSPVKFPKPCIYMHCPIIPFNFFCFHFRFY